MSASTSKLETPSAPLHPKAMKRNASVRHKRLNKKASATESRLSIIFQADEEGPELIPPEDQIKEVVDEACEKIGEIEKNRASLSVARKATEMRRAKIDGKRRALKVLRAREEHSRTMGDQIKKLSLGQLENRLDRAKQRLNKLIAETGAKKVKISENRVLRLESERIMHDSVLSIRTIQGKVDVARKETNNAQLAAQNAKAEMKRLAALLEKETRKTEAAEMSARKIINQAKASEMTDAVAMQVQAELERKGEARQQVENAKRAKAVTVAAQIAGFNAADRWDKVRESGVRKGADDHAEGAMKLDGAAAQIIAEMAGASAEAFNQEDQGFGGLSNDQEDDMKRLVARTRWKAAGKFASIRSVLGERDEHLQFFQTLGARQGGAIDRRGESYELVYEAFLASVEVNKRLHEDLKAAANELKQTEMQVLLADKEKMVLLGTLRGATDHRARAQVIDYQHSNRKVGRQIVQTREERDWCLETLVQCREMMERCFDDPGSKWDSPPGDVFQGSDGLRRVMDLLNFGVRRTDPESVMWQDPLGQARPLEMMCKLKNAWARVEQLG